VQLHRDRHRFEEEGANLALIGQGQPEQARDFKRSQKLDGITLLADSQRDAYRAAGAKKATVGELVGPKVVAKGIVRGARQRLRQGLTVGHPAQLGGVLVVDTSGAVVWSHLAEDASDNPANDTVLDAVRTAA
jgi:hypothetical protein